MGAATQQVSRPRFALEVRGSLVGTALGWIGLAYSDAGLRWLILPRASRQEVETQLIYLGAIEPATLDDLGDLPDRLRRYVGGEAVEFTDRLDLSHATPFFREVWQATCEIPRGETRSYGSLAARVGRPGAARAIGLAMQRNSVPIVVPCHRVIAFNGSLGGYGGGLKLKRALLQLEGAYDG